jgi:hypothetical protein
VAEDRYLQMMVPVFDLAHAPVRVLSAAPRSRNRLMRLHHVCLAGLLGLLAACGNERSGEDEAAPVAKAPANAAATSYAECMAAANRQASRAENVVKASECLRLPDAPPPGSTLPAGVPALPPIAGHGVPQGAEQEIRSVYTTLAEADCRTLSVDEESASSVQRCPGVGGYALNAADGDARMSIDVITPDGKAHPLHFWSVVTHAFSSLGPRAEWRVRGEQPIALIVRVNASEDPENTERYTSYLAVAKITPTRICVTDRIGPAANANEEARRAADASASRPCAPEAQMR